MLDSRHDYLKNKVKWYETWHKKSYSNKIHWSALLVFCGLLALSGAYYLVPQKPKRSSASISPLTLGHPRLAAHNVKTSTSPYDSIWLNSYTSDNGTRIASLRASNPDIVILSYIAAREVNWSRTAGYDNIVNTEIRSTSTDWMLTLAGSTLNSSINSTVTNVSVTNASLFTVGQCVLIGGTPANPFTGDSPANRTTEIAYVSARDTTANTLTLIRGEFWPTKTHAPGVRIVPTMHIWGGGNAGVVEYDVRSSTPRVDVGYGPETFADWNARRAKNIHNALDWDGLTVDVFDAQPRNIAERDINRDNAIDSTSEKSLFASDYYSGMIAFGDTLRTALGTEAIIVVNGPIFSDKVNGRNFEGAPGSGSDWTVDVWELIMAGNWKPPNETGYKYYCDNATNPNYTNVTSYGGATDYRYMRFGLTTTLMNCGFFSYGTGSSGGTGSLWFDEFDNAGAGQGYLGQPKGVAAKVSTTLTGGVDHVWRRDFQNGISIVNPNTTGTVTVQLGGTFKKIHGNQDRTVNNGATVTSVTLQPRDGIILLRESSGGTGGTCTIVNGDINGDGNVNISDAAILMAKWNQYLTSDPADINCSGRVDISDAAILMARWGT